MLVHQRVYHVISHYITILQGYPGQPPFFMRRFEWPEVFASAAEDLTSCGGSGGSYGCPYGGFLKWWNPIAGWFMRGNPFQIDDLGVTPISGKGNLHVPTPNQKWRAKELGMEFPGHVISGTDLIWTC